MLAVLLKKQIMTPKISEFEKELTDHDHDKYITTSNFNTLAVSVFNAKLAQANLITKTNFDVRLSSLNKKLPQIKQTFTC